MAVLLDGRVALSGRMKDAARQREKEKKKAKSLF
jgi:hypothetical protein